MECMVRTDDPASRSRAEAAEQDRKQRGKSHR